MKYIAAFIGFGEAGYHIASGLTEDGLTRVIAYDAMQDDSKRGPVIRQRADKAGVPLASSVDEAVKGADFIISLTTASVAASVAESIIPHLQAGQVYVDFNSVAPNVLKKIDSISRQEGVLICDGAVLGNVQKNKHRVSIYLCGSGAQAFYDAFSPYHMKLKVFDTPIGSASGIKMLKSVYSKGLQQLVLEFVLASERCGVLREMMVTVHNPMEGKTLEEYANEAMPRMIIHASRRTDEIRNAAEMVEEMGLNAGMSRAACEKFARLAKLEIPDSCPELSQMGYEELAKVVLDRLDKAGK